MKRPKFGLVAAALVPVSLIAMPPRRARADAAANCRVVDVDFTPTDRLQIVAWVEDAHGNFIDTVYLTQGIGTYGLGNRPGVMEFNSGPHWPYGRRETTFPVWAHRHGLTFPALVYQNSTDMGDANDRNLSHPFSDSSREMFYCRPMRADEVTWDTATCASPANSYSDKGVFSPTRTSLYPPRADLVRGSTDSASVAMFDELNPFDSVSQATPAGGVKHTITWPIPQDLATGDYVLMVETAKEADHNDVYNPTTYPGPENIPWSDYGEPYRGQPSIVYSVPFRIGTGETTASTASYAGYGDPDAQDGNVRAPDDTITTTVPGSGAARFELTSEGDGAMARVHVSARPELDSGVPGAVTEGHAASVDQDSAQLSFVAPGDDGMIGKVAGYELRLRAGSPVTEANFADSMPVSTGVVPDEPGQVQLFDVSGLLPETDYYVGIRATDDCHNAGPVASIAFRTTERVSGAVDACFVATAAYGSLMANDVELLRHFRDSMLRNTVLGELAVETYYTFGPTVAGVISESELLRATARGVLRPVIGAVRTLKVLE